MSEENQFDYVIVGGGSAGCVLANRLSADPNIRVCLIEAGGTHKSAFIRVPALVAATMMSKIKNWAFPTVPQTALNNRECYQPRGKALGGSSSTNAMIYIRGVPADYDRWASLGNAGWSYQDVLPYFKKSQHRESGTNEFHAQGGELNVAPLQDPSPINQRFLRAAQNQGFVANDDFNGSDQEGVGMYEVTQIRGERCSAARAFLEPIWERPNLKIVTRARTHRILFDSNKRAIGVEVKRFFKTQKITAQREVILSAGAFGSPQLLMLSGIGSPEKLEPHGIEVMHDLPGVGENAATP
ncbi:MAG: GMC family oxidoreductase N-terminal domain-containing protein, partial [Pseudomonadota bacterium]